MDNFPRYSILDWQTFSFTTLNISSHCLWPLWCLMRNQLLIVLRITCMWWLTCLLMLSGVTFRAWCFLLWTVVCYWFNFFNRYRPIKIVCFFLWEIWQIVPFKELVHFIQVINFVGTELFIIFLYYPLNMGSLVMFSLSSLIFVICVFSLSFLASLTRSLLILWIFSKNQNQLLILLIFFTDFVFNFINICSNFYHFFLLCTLHLICSSFSSFLRWKLIDFGSVFSFNCIQCYKFPSKHRFCCIPQILVSWIFIFI